MPLKHGVESRLLAISALATLGFATVAAAQPYGPGQGGPGNMMGGGMGGFGGIGVLMLALSSWVLLSLRFVAEVCDAPLGWRHGTGPPFLDPLKRPWKT
jgi:hypothetical protein